MLTLWLKPDDAALKTGQLWQQELHTCEHRCKNGEVILRHPLRALVLLCALAMLVAACGGTATSGGSSTTATVATAPVTLNVFAAASLSNSFKEIATKYQAAHPNVKITYNFNGSQLLEQQISQGAAADVFA